MLRLLILILLAYLVYRGIESLVRGRLRGNPGNGAGSGAFRPGPSPAPQVTVIVHRPEAEELVPCSRCGVRVPQSRTVAGEGGKSYCGECGGA